MTVPDPSFGGGDDDDRAALVALSGLPGVGPARLRALLEGRRATEAWEYVRNGRVALTPELAVACAGQRLDVLVGRWTAAARDTDASAVWARHMAAGVTVLVPGDDGWPAALVDDPDPPAVLFTLGEVAVLGGGPAAAIVGTRQCSRYGWDVAHQLGADLAAAGVTVVSGLASGIDGAAHRGVLDTPVRAAPVGVVATGLDVVYPRGHRGLWNEIAGAGVLVTESPLGTAPARWRFPARNRIIAALAGATVVVESAAAGGAMHTVDEATRRDRPVLAVPGPVTSRSSVGTNRLLAEGAVPACDAGDVLLALGLGGRRPPRMSAPPAPGGDAGRLLDALGWQPATLDQLVLRTGMALGTAARLATELEVDGWLSTDGGWFERRR